MSGEERSEATRLETVDVERLGRLRAEWQLAEAQARLAELAFKRDLTTTCRRLGVTGPFHLDLAQGCTLEEGGHGDG